MVVPSAIGLPAVSATKTWILVVSPSRPQLRLYFSAEIDMNRWLGMPVDTVEMPPPGVEPPVVPPVAPPLVPPVVPPLVPPVDPLVAPLPPENELVPASPPPPPQAAIATRLAAAITRFIIFIA